MMFLKRFILPALLAAILSGPPSGLCTDPPRPDSVTLVTDFTYLPAKGESRQVSEALALFGARMKATASAAKYLDRKGFLEHYGKKRKEIFCLVAKEMTSTPLETAIPNDSGRLYVKIQATITGSDFIQAENRNAEMEKEQIHESFRQKMAEAVSDTIDPGIELSRVYRLFRLTHWRAAVIYLDHLEKKYPHWGELFLAKAIAFNELQQTTAMKKALQNACSLGNQESCDDLQMLVEVHGNQFDLY